jgi:hypothetical protein
MVIRNITSPKTYKCQYVVHTSRLKADSYIACRAHAVPLPCRATKGLECVFPIWFTQCGRVWFIKMWSVNQARPHCVNQMGKTHFKPLAARHGRGTAWERHAMCESAFRHQCCRLVRQIISGSLVQETAWSTVHCVMQVRIQIKYKTIHHQLTGLTIASILQCLTSHHRLLCHRGKTCAQNS